MNIFKQATAEKLRFTTPKGVLTTEQLWDLKLSELDSLAVQYEKVAQEGNTKSFLVAKTQENKTAQLQFDIILEILQDKQAAENAKVQAREIRAYNDRIAELISQKKDTALANLSVEELEKMMKS